LTEICPNRTAKVTKSIGKIFINLQKIECELRVFEEKKGILVMA